MRFAPFFLALCCGAAMAQTLAPEVPLPATRPTESWMPSVAPNAKFPSPPGLSVEQAQGWNVWANSPGVKSVAIIHLDASVFATPSVNVNIGGKTHMLVGQVSRREQQMFEHPRGGPFSVNPANTTWFGESGRVVRFDDGGVMGEIYIPVDATGNIKQRYIIQGNPSKGGAVFLVASDPLPRHPPTASSAASGVQK